MLDQVGQWLFDAGLTPHGFCLLWEPGLLLLHGLSDAVIGVAYFAIPVALLTLARRRRDLVFRPLFGLFATFILLCGTTHWLSLLTLFVPAYGIEGVIKAATAIISLGCAGATFALLPKALDLPSPAQMRDAHEALRRTEERLHQVQKMEAVGRLTGGIAHDFNNSLQGILGALDIVENRLRSGRADRLDLYLGSMRRSAERAAGLTRQLLSFARAQPLESRPLRLGDLVRRMTPLITTTLGPTITLGVETQDTWPARADAVGIESALLNLVLNARHAIEGVGDVRITTRDRTLQAEDLPLHAELEPGDFVEVAVTDTGCGMAPEVLEHAFEPFFTTKAAGEGTGLGLSQVFGFVTQSHGTVALESEPGRGTTARLFLPRSTMAESAENRSEGTPTTADAALSGTVLLVDDQAEVRLPMAKALRESGLEVVEAANGRAALESMQTHGGIDLVVTDLGMPDLTGSDLVRALRERHPTLPIVVITGYAGPAGRDLPTGPHLRVLLKPFATTTLLAIVRQSLLRASQPA